MNDQRPQFGEYDPYYQSYIKLLPEGDLLQILTNQSEETKKLLKNTTENQGLFQYAPEKWTLKEVLGHMADTERVMAYRLFCIARGETVSLPGFDENKYVQNASFKKLSVEELLEDLSVVRQSTLHFIKNLQPEDWIKQGIANDSKVTVRAIANIIAGHELHHCSIIKERYMNAEAFPNN